ncbi:MAG: hypothetical protein ACFFAO_09620 [Candidatus Hermodarchaeota archaeon]
MIFLILRPFDVLNSILQAIFIITTVIIGLMIISKYFKYKERVFLMVGLAWIGMVEPWMASVSNLLFTLINGYTFNVQVYLLIGITFIPFSLFFWFVAITDLMYEKRQKLILSIIAIYGILFEIYFIFFLIVDPAVLAVLHGVINIEYMLPLQIYIISVLALAIIAGFNFALTSMKSKNPEVRLKGKFLLIAFILFAIGAFSDLIFIRDILTLLITRFILISSSIFFYLGFILPEFIRNKM